MIIIQKNSESIVIGRTSEVSIAVLLFNSWNGTINTVLVSDIATTNEADLLKKIAYSYAEKVDKRGSTDTRDHILSIFQESFDEYQVDSEKELVNEFYFNNSHGRFIQNTYASSDQAIADIVKKVEDSSKVLISIDVSDGGNILERSIYTVSFKEESENNFSFWNSNNWPERRGQGLDLHIVPDYHPSSPSQGGNSFGPLINGATDALIRSTAISSVYAPIEARQEKEGHSGSSWNYMKHPYKAIGKSFQFTLRGFYHSTKELVDDAVELILAALGNHPKGCYVGVSGGFYPTYDFPQNIAGRTGRKLPKKEPRGSEKHCMWTYDVLTKEDELDKAYVPDWFYSENWLELFEGQEGIFPKFFWFQTKFIAILKAMLFIQHSFFSSHFPYHNPLTLLTTSLYTRYPKKVGQ